MSAGWNTIESDAGVFTYLLENLGVKGVQFEELLSLEKEELESLSPIYGVIFLFKYPTNETKSSTPKDGTYDHSAAETLFFANQVIQNACGTQALMSVLLNKDDEIDIGSKLKEFKDFAGVLPPEFRGEVFSNSELIRETHNSFARASPFVDETVRQATEDDDVYHFIAYTSINGTLYELDGLQPAPINHGPATGKEFPEKVIPVLQRRIARYPATEIRFNLMAMVRDRRIQAREFGDRDALLAEERKRSAWIWENSLRKHNFVGFIGEILKGVVKQKTADGSYDKWIQDAVGQTGKRLEDRQRGKVADEDLYE